jgi:hypothetical protein
MPIQLIIRNPLDRDAREYIQRAGVSDAGGRIQLNEFVRGIKGLGLWNSIICWPLRSTQNAGTGTTAFSLGGLGTFNGTLVNGPVWGANGILFDAAATTHITTGLDVQNLRKFTAMVATEQRAQVGASNGMIAAWGPTTASSYFIMRKTALSAVNVFVRSGGANLQSSLTAGNGGTPDWRVWGWGTIGSNTVLTNGGAATAVSVASLPDETGSSTITIGIQTPPSGSPYDGTIAWVMFTKDAELSTAQQASVYTLFKTTLGTGLGLP